MLMFRVLIYLGLAVVASTANAENWRDFQVRTQSFWTIQATGSGKVSVTKERVSLELDSFSIRLHSNATSDETFHVIAIRIGVDQPKEYSLLPDGAAISNEHLVARDVSSGETLKLENFSASFARPVDLEGTGYWVLVQIITAHPEFERGYTYAYEEAGIEYQ